MSARISWVLQDEDGNGLPGQTVKLHRKSTGAEIGTFIGDANGNYYYDHAISEKVIVKVNGVTVTSSDGIMHVADDLPISGDLASTAAGKGASLIGVEDSMERFSGTDLEAVLLEIPTLVGLASTEGGFGAASIGSHDAGGYYDGTNVEAILQEIGAIVSLLDGLTATAAELNKLDGAGAGVTAVNLNILTGGDISDAGELHRHDMGELLGNTLIGAGREDMSLNLKPQFTEQYGMGNVCLDVVHTDIQGRALVRKFGSSEQDIQLVDIMTAYEIGDLNFSGSPIIGNVLAPGKITQAIRLLANFAMSAAGNVGLTRTIIWTAASTAASGSGDEATDPATTAMWTEKGADFKRKLSLVFVQTPEMRYLRMRGKAKVESGGTGRVHLEATHDALVGDALHEIEETVFTEFALDIDLQYLIPVTIPTMTRVNLYLGDGDEVHEMALNGEMTMWVEK